MINFRPRYSFGPTLSSPHVFAGLPKLESIPLPKPPRCLFVSRELLEELQENAKKAFPSGPPGAISILTPLDAIELRIAPWLPLAMPTGRLLSNDRWTAYDARDAAWAVPAGLARWETRTTHFISIDDRASVIAAQCLATGQLADQVAKSFADSADAMAKFREELRAMFGK